MPTASSISICLDSNSPAPAAGGDAADKAFDIPSMADTVIDTVAKNILNQIVQTKRKAIAQAKRDRPLAQLRAELADVPHVRNFFTACTRRPRGPVNVIAEVKKASPSAGVIRQDFDPADIARQYAAAGHAPSACSPTGPTSKVAWTTCGRSGPPSSCPCCARIF